MKKVSTFTAALLLTVNLSGCGQASTDTSGSSESSQSQTETTAPAEETAGSSADDTAEAATEATTEITEHYGFDFFMVNKDLHLGMSESDVKYVMGEPDKTWDDEPNPAFEYSIAYNIDNADIYNLSFDIPSSVIFYFDREGYLSQLSYDLGSQVNSDVSSFYSSGAELKADKQQLYDEIVKMAGEPSKTEYDDFNGNEMYTWYSYSQFSIWLSGAENLWGIEGLSYNTVTVSISTEDGQAIAWSDYDQPDYPNTGSGSSYSSSNTHDGVVGDNDGDGDIDEDDWEKEWNDYINDKMNEYDYGNTYDGIIGDNDYDGDIDENDWEKEWNDYLNDKLSDY